MRLSLSIFIGIGGGRAASWVVYEVRALHGTSPHPARLRGSPAGLFRPPAPPFCMWLRCFASGRARGPFQPGGGLPRRSRGSPGDLGTVECGNAVHVREPSGISVRILCDCSFGAHRRTAREGHTKRPCGRVDMWGSEPHAMTETNTLRVSSAGVSTKKLDTPSFSQIGQNQAPATHRSSSSYHLRSSPQLLVQLRRRIAAIKAGNPRLLRKQTQHH